MFSSKCTHTRKASLLTRQALKCGEHEAVALAVHPQAEQLAAVADARHVHLLVGRNKGSSSRH